jgi:type I phosphodiesterase/nucleotide pyrophosphatase
MRIGAFLIAFLTLRWGPTPSANQRSLLRSRRWIETPFYLVCIAAIATISCRSRESQTPAPTSSPVSAAPQIASQATSGKRVIFIGLDGADWSLLDQYVSRGVMPTLAKLVSEGSSGTVKTISPPLSPLIWTTMMTGVSPLEHRILDFLRVNPTSQQREPITSDERKVPAVWNMATAGGKKVGALGYWATYPAESVNGLMVSDRLFTFLFSETSPPPGVVHPASMESWARDGLKRAQDDVGYEAVKAILPWLTEAEYAQAVAVTDPYAHPVSALRRILIETKVYDELGRDWYSRENPDVLLLYIQGTDSIGHVFAPYAPPRQSSVSEADYNHYKDVAERYFALIDQLLARYVALAQKTGSTIMLASDHGFLWGEGRRSRAPRIRRRRSGTPRTAFISFGAPVSSRQQDMQAQERWIRWPRRCSPWQDCLRPATLLVRHCLARRRRRHPLSQWTTERCIPRQSRRQRHRPVATRASMKIRSPSSVRLAISARAKEKGARSEAARPDR